MKVGFIGAGKVGTAFGLYLMEAGIEVVGYYSRREASSMQASKITKTRCFKDCKTLIEAIDTLFITTNDSNIRVVVEQLNNENLLRSDMTIIHMSGAHSSEILIGDNTTYNVYSLHPLQAFADVDKAVEDLKTTVFTIEGNKDNVDILTGLMDRLGNAYFIISKEDKTLYHASACIVSNYLVTLMDVGLKVFEEIGIDGEDGFKALLPLIEGTIENIKSFGTAKALTGPISRGDSNTVKEHLNQLDARMNEFTDFYKLMGRMTTEVASREKLKDESDLIKLEEVLEGKN